LPIAGGHERFREALSQVALARSDVASRRAAWTVTTSDDHDVSTDVVDFFISYTHADRPWAEWIAWELEHAGHSVVIQAWDFAPGSNFVLAMHEAAQRARHTVAVLSPAFLESPYAAAEWAGAFGADPTDQGRKLVPVRVRECNPDGLLGAIVYVDIVGLSEKAARAALLAGVTAGGHGPPPASPAFPATHEEGGGGARVQRPDAGAPTFNVPVTTRTFVGRQQQLRDLEEGLSASAVAITQVYAIHGVEGVGKTQLAARYAREHRADYDVIWWLRAEQESRLHTDLASLAVELGLTDAEADEQDSIAAVQRWLEAHGRWLLVFDNVTGPDAITDLVPEGNAGHVLITSRAYADWRVLNATPLALDVFKRVESRRFLTRRTDEHDRVALDEVAAALGDLPLALESAAAHINTNASSLAEYVGQLRERVPPTPTQESRPRPVVETSPRLRVFLCHSSGDKAAVRRLDRRLRTDGIDTWLDERALLPGQEWEPTIREAVREVDVVIVCLSGGSITKSGYVQTEIRHVLDVADEQPEGATFLIPARIEECAVPERLKRWHWVDLHKRGGYKRLLAALHEAGPHTR
jgi:TIR domain/NB-ARC domain